MADLQGVSPEFDRLGAARRVKIKRAARVAAMQAALPKLTKRGRAKLVAMGVEKVAKAETAEEALR